MTGTISATNLLV
jgi:hypothetical protein